MRSCPRRWWLTAARCAPPRAPGRAASMAASWSRASSFVVCDKHGSLLDLELHPANTDDRAGILPTLPRLAALGFEGDLLGDSGFKGAPFAEAALEHDIHVSVSPGGTRDGRFLPHGIRWVVERLLAWMSRYRRLNIVYDRAPDLFAAHIWIAMISIISRRLVAKTQPQ